MKTKNLSVCLYTIVLFFSACAGTHPASPNPTSDTQIVAVPADKSSAELNRIKALEGKWQSITSMLGTNDQRVFTEYKVTAGGSAVVETIFPGTPQEMISVYYDDDNGKLAMTHYCMLRNRPYFSLAESKRNAIKLDVAKIEGLKEKDMPSMGAITLKFKDANNFSSTCEGDKAHKNHRPMTMNFTRVKG